MLKTRRVVLEPRENDYGIFFILVVIDFSLKMNIQIESSTIVSESFGERESTPSSFSSFYYENLP